MAIFNPGNCEKFGLLSVLGWDVCNGCKQPRQNLRDYFP
jgi:hypothetical protein